MFKAFYCGIITLVSLYIILFLTVWFDFDKFGILLFYIQIISPFVAAFIVSYLAPKKQIILGMAIILPAVIFGGFFKFVCWFLDIPVDYFGFSGEIIVVILYCIAYAPICFVGALLGYFLHKYTQLARR
jgi:hypothetical protein